VTGQTTLAASATANVSGLRQNRLTLASGTLANPTTLTVANQGGSNGLVVLNNLATNGGTGPLGLSLGNDATLDVNDNDVVLYYDPAGPNPTATIQGYIDNFYSFATGVPVIASTQTFVTSGDTVIIAVDNATTFLGDAQAMPFYDLTLGDTAATPIGFNQVIVRYTWNGDYNLDGVVDGLDYSVVDNFLDQLTGGPGVQGFTMGDGNFDGIVDATDYGFIDANFGKGGPLGGGSLASVGNQQNSIAVIPEPSTLVLGALGAIGFGCLALRNRRNLRRGSK
jgi:hypothetical protein